MVDTKGAGGQGQLEVAVVSVRDALLISFSLRSNKVGISLQNKKQKFSRVPVCL